jgi:hypothetical protein
MDIKEIKKKKKKIFLHLICTKKYSNRLGEKLMNYIIENICDKCVIDLESVPSARPFYEKMGFKLIPGSAYDYTFTK